MTPARASPFSEAFSSAATRSNLTVWASFFVGGRRKNTRKHTRSISMKLTTLATALAVTLAFAQTAHAREHHHRQGLSHRSSVYPEAGRHWVAHRYSATTDANYKSAWSYRNSATEAFAWSAQSAYHGGYGGRPRAWCGWQMRQLVGIDPGPQFNLARNWTRWGTPRAGRHRRRGRMAASRRQDRRPRRRHVDHSIRQ